MRKRIICCLLAAVLGIGTLSGCGGGTKSSTPGTNAAGGTETSAGKKEGGENVVTFSMSEDVYTWDPMGQPVVPFYCIQLLI